MDANMVAGGNKARGMNGKKEKRGERVFANAQRYG